MPEQTLWNGRFREALAKSALDFSTSIDLDGRLYQEDIAGSVAHVEMLAATGVLADDEAAAIRDALIEIDGEIERGDLELRGEDIHTVIEGRLTEMIGSLGGKLHTGRSRNDQIALDERLYFRRVIDEIDVLIDKLQQTLVSKADEYFGALMPGYTHTQRAQPILLSHHLLAYVEMLERDRGRFADCRARLNKSPLGAAAIAGTSFPLDRRMVASKLGFDGIVCNSIDAVSDRDYLLEFTSACSIAMMHLSRLAEEIILWSTREFRFITISDAYATGSSIMPQKKNPDMAELVRGKTGRVYGDLINLLTMMKGTPLAYNRDMQEDKFPAFDAADTLCASLGIFSEMLDHAAFNRERMEDALRDDFPTATEVADYLVRRDVPFREAHAITGKIVAFCVEHGRTLDDLTLDELRSFSSMIDEEIFSCLSPRDSIALKQTEGSTAPKEVRRQIEEWKEKLAAVTEQGIEC